MKNEKAGLEQTRMKFALADPINYQDLCDQKCNTALHELINSDLKLRITYGKLKRLKQDLFILFQCKSILKYVNHQKLLFLENAQKINK